MDAWFEHPDIPYRTRFEHRGDGSIAIIVEAEVLAGGDNTEVEAECYRRAKQMRDAFLSLRP